MCHSMYYSTIPYKFSDSITQIHKFGPTICKLNINPSFLGSKTILGSRHYFTKLFKNPRKIEQIFVNYSSNGFDFDTETSLKEDNDLGLEFSNDNNDDNLQVFDGNDSDEFDGLNFDETLKGKEKEKVNSKAKNRVLNGEELVEVEEVKIKRKGKLGFNGSEKKQLIKRSNLLAKQVIGIQSALSLGFVSQLWVDTASWAVLEVEVRPSLLSSESGKVLLEDIERVGDVVLVQDETFVLNEFRTVGLETLVGYNVVTPRGRNLGKVRGYTFNINSGAVESLELDAFGYSIVPSSLVTTYALFTEDVLQVVSDTIIVHDSASSHIQRVTKGFLSTMNLDSLRFNSEYDDLKEESARPEKTRKSRRKSSKRKSYPGTRKFDDDLDLPMDYM